MYRSHEKPSREAPQLSDLEIIALECRTAVGCLRAAREQLELAALSMAVVSSVDGDGESFRETDDLLDAARQIATALERQIARRALVAERCWGELSAPGLARTKAKRAARAEEADAATEGRSSRPARGRRAVH